MRLTCEKCGLEFTSRRSTRRYCSRVCSNQATGPKLTAKANDAGARPVVWSCGGGVDSAAIAALVVMGELPKPDYAVMVDVGYEQEHTWEYVRRVLVPELGAVGVALKILKTQDNRLVRLGHCVLPAYRRQPDGSVAKLPTHCTGPWKAQTAQRWLRAQGVERVEQWIGIAADEAQRAKPSPKAWTRLRWPLIEMGLTREACHRVIARAGWSSPERSNCHFCPQRSQADWRHMVAKHPEEFRRACAAEATIQREVPGTYLHRRAVPLDVAVNGCVQMPDTRGEEACTGVVWDCG